MLTEMVELSRKMKEQMKATQSEIRQNIQGTNSDGKETGTQINGVEERNIQPEKNEETRIQKNEKRLRKLQEISKCSNIQIIGVPEGEKEEQQIENLFENIMKENFPNLAKEIDSQEVQKAQSHKGVEPKEAHTKAHHNYITQDESEVENLKSSKRKGELPTKEFPEGYQLISQKKPYRQEGAGKKYSQS